MRYGTISLSSLQPSEFIFFTSYTLARLLLLASSFLTLLENYDLQLQLQHLSPHSLALVMIFVHFCKMYVGDAVIGTPVLPLPHAASLW
jgi:hypothetical protein